VNNQTGNVFITKQVTFGLESAPQHWPEAQYKSTMYHTIPRCLHRFWTWLAGYFWMPCPICQRPFGGHEHCWATDGKGHCTCPDCAVNGRAFTTQITINLDAIQAKANEVLQ